MCTSVNCVCGNGDLASRTPASAGKTYFCPVSVKRHGASPDQTCTAHPADGASSEPANQNQPARVGDCASLYPYENSRSPPTQRCDREHRPSSPSRSPTPRPSAPQPRRGAPSPARAGRPLRDQQREHLRKRASRQYHVPATPRAAPRRNRSMPHTSPASPDGISSPRTCIIQGIAERLARPLKSLNHQPDPRGAGRAEREGDWRPRRSSSRGPAAARASA